MKRKMSWLWSEGIRSIRWRRIFGQQLRDDARQKQRTADEGTQKAAAAGIEHGLVFHENCSVYM
jgi:hypothetical protein